MFGPRSKRSLRAVWTSVQAAMYPERKGDADFRRAFEEEAQRSNALLVRGLVLLALVLNALILATLLRRTEEQAASAAWISWAIGGSSVGLVCAIAAGLVAWRRRPEVLWRGLGDYTGALCLLGVALRSANAQRAHPTLNVFITGAFVAALFLRMRPQFFAPALLAAALVVLGGIRHFREDGTARSADEISLLAASLAALLGFFFTRAMRARELLARRQVELMNADLERRVDAQVHEIVEHAREIEQLNAQLNEKIRERSRELSRALARLAEGYSVIEPGTVLGGRVEIGAKIGHGGMGDVYRGRDLVTGKTVAVKVVQAGSEQALDGMHRFLREARALASVTHSAIVRSIHVDVSDDGRLFQMMELVEGQTLESHLARCVKLPPHAVSRLGAVLAEALAAAHGAGVVHRDVKPANVMLTRTSPGLKLLDFGISTLREAQATGGTAEDTILGTPAFLSPERVISPGDAAAPADVYALGVLLYLCVAGRLPFADADPRIAMLVHVARAPLDLVTCLPGLDPALSGAVMACLRKAPDERPTASALAETLAKIADAAETPPLEALGLVREAGPEREAAEAVAPTVKC